jgi:hypothetical protein
VRKRNGLLLLLVLALAVACGGSKKAGDRGREAIDELVAAAQARDVDAMWDNVTEATRRRLGKTQTAAVLERRLARFAGRSYRTVVSQLVTEEFGVVAISTPAAIVALPFAKDGKRLRAELGGALRVEPTGPRPGVHRERVIPQVAVEVKQASGEPTVALYLDGETLLPKVYSAGSSATVFSTLPGDFTRGRHTVVAFAATAETAAATAWSFTVR